MVNQALDALVLASLDTDVQIKRLAALWCRSMDSSTPSSKKAALSWVKREFGPILNKEILDHISLKLVEEISLQSRLRARRRRNKPTEPLGKRDRNQRIGLLIQSNLGPAHTWVSRYRLTAEEGFYVGGGIYSGLIVGIIPVTMNIRRIVNPNLLVYRTRGHEPKSYWIPGDITDVAAAFDWLLPLEVRELVSLGAEVEHDGERQSVIVRTPYGTKTVPWRSL